MVNLATGFLVISRTARNIFAPSGSRLSVIAISLHVVQYCFALSLDILSGGAVSCVLIP